MIIGKNNVFYYIMTGVNFAKKLIPVLLWQR